jgi:integrase
VSKKLPHLTVKGGRFYFRLRVPTELQASLGKREITQALGGVNQDQARVLVDELAGQWKRLFLTEMHRLGLAFQPPAPSPVAPIKLREPSAEEVRALAQLAARSMLAEDMEGRIEGTASAPHESASFGLGQPLDASLKAAIAGRDMSGVQMQAEDWLQAHGLTLPANVQDARRTLMTWATEMAKARKGQRLRDDGEPVETPEAPALPASLQPVAKVAAGKMSAHHLKLRDVLGLWAADERTRPAKTIQKATGAVAIFEALTENPSLGHLTKAMGAEFRLALLASETKAGTPISEKTASDRLTWIQILLNFEADRYGRIAANPWKGLIVKVKKTTTREDWKDADASKLFALPLFQKYESPVDKNAGADAGYWLPILAAFTGARITELAQLLVADIQREDDQWYIRFEVTQPWQSLKREASARTIPMHTELVRLGLPEYAAAMHKDGELRLFPAIVVSDLNNAGGGPSKWFSTLKIAAGFGPANTFHGWRNTIETKLQRAREGQLFIDRYLRHKPQGSEGVGYERLKPADLIETAEKVVYQGLALPRVYGYEVL